MIIGAILDFGIAICLFGIGGGFILEIRSEYLTKFDKSVMVYLGGLTCIIGLVFVRTAYGLL